MRKFILPIVCVLGLVVLGCQSLVDRITPAEIPQSARKYVNADPNQFTWPTLRTLENLRFELFSTHRDNQLDLARLIEDDKNEVDDLRRVVDFNIQESKEIQTIAVGTEAQPGLLWSLLLGGGMLYTGGKFIKRPQEKKLEAKVTGDK